MNALAGLNPDDADYQEKVNAIAEQKAEKVKARFLKRAELRMKVADILTDEQLEKFDNMKKKRGKKQRKHS
jgi:Spy/CpxP family protein refolding chaperone